MKKSNEAKLFIVTPPRPRPEKSRKKKIILDEKTLKKRSMAVWKFIETHPGITIYRMTKAAGYDPGNFAKYMNNKRRLPQHLLIKVENYLKDYGLKVHDK